MENYLKKTRELIQLICSEQPKFDYLFHNFDVTPEIVMEIIYYFDVNCDTIPDDKNNYAGEMCYNLFKYICNCGDLSIIEKLIDDHDKSLEIVLPICIETNNIDLLKFIVDNKIEIDYDTYVSAIASIADLDNFEIIDLLMTNYSQFRLDKIDLEMIFDNLHKIGNHDALEYFCGIYNIDPDK